MLNRFRIQREATKATRAFDVDQRLGSIVPVIRPENATPKQNPETRIVLPPIQEPTLAIQKPKNAFHLIDPSNPNNDATKSVAFSQYVQDFIYNNGVYSQPYSDPQLEMAFWTSVYLFAAFRRISNLISRVKVVAEYKMHDTWLRMPESSRLNEMLTNDMPNALRIGYLNYGIYGKTLSYKTKTHRAMMARAAGKPIYRYDEGAVSGFIVLDNPGWSINETSSSGYNSLKGVFVNYDYKDILGDQNYLDRREFIYITDWNPRNKNHGRSIASVAIHEAVTNAAIARWASDYFTRGTLPMLLVSMTDNPAIMTEADLAKQKRFFEDQYQGQSASLRSVFVDQKVDVNEIGITADRVAAPELNKNALEGISAAVGIERDLIIAPEGGTQSRHQAMIQQAWNDTIIPLAQGFVAQYQQDLGLPENVRLVIDVSHIAELEADRGDKSTAELAIFEKSVQTLNESRMRLNQKPIPELKNFMLVNGELKSIKKILLEDQLPSEKIFNQITGAWDSDLILKSQAMEMLGRKMRPGEKDGYKSELAPTEGSGGGLDGGSDPETPNPDDGGGDDSPPETPTKPTPETETETSTSIEEPTKADASFLELLSEYDEPEDDGEYDPESEAIEVFLPETVTVEEPTDMSIFVSIPLTNNAVVVEMKRKLQRAFGEQVGIRWKSDDSLHMTILFAERVSNEVLKLIVDIMPTIYVPTLSIGPLLVFEQERKNVVTLEVCLDQQLQALQQSVVSAFQAYSVELSEFSVIGAWNPHITMCEVDKDVEIPDFNYHAKIRPGLVTFSRTSEIAQLFVKLKSSEHESDVVFEPHYMDAILEKIEKRREDLANSILAFRDTGDRGDLPDQVFDWINEYIDKADVFTAAIQACEAGMLDDDAFSQFNPLERYLKGIQRTPQDELAAWKKVAKTNIQKARNRFQVSKIPMEVEEFVRSSLIKTDGAKSNLVDPIFTKAFDMLDDYTIYDATNPVHLAALYDRLSASEDEELKSLVTGMA